MPCPVALVEWFHASLLSVLQTCEDSNVELIVVVALFYCVLCASVMHCITDLPVVVVPFLANCPP